MLTGLYSSCLVTFQHNVQTTSDGSRLLATVMPAGDMEMEGMVEELVVVDVAAGISGAWWRRCGSRHCRPRPGCCGR